MRAYDRKKQYRQNVARIQKTGQGNLGTGQWTKLPSNSMSRDMVNGASHRKVS